MLAERVIPSLDDDLILVREISAVLLPLQCSFQGVIFGDEMDCHLIGKQLDYVEKRIHRLKERQEEYVRRKCG